MCADDREFPDNLYEFAYFPKIDDNLSELSDLAEPEDWKYKYTKSDSDSELNKDDNQFSWNI